MKNQIQIKYGDKYNRWMVLNETEHTKYKNSTSRNVRCRCDCGVEKIVSLTSLLKGLSKSCGCLNAEQVKTRSITHGLRNHPLYAIWTCMKARCNNPNTKKYAIYGARGIKVCDEWENSFQQFYDDMINAYQKGLSIDRIDNSKGYSKYNCRWSTMQEQCNNRRVTRKETYNGKEYSLKDLAVKLNIKYERLYKRLYNGMSLEQAIQRG